MLTIPSPAPRSLLLCSCLALSTALAACNLSDPLENQPERDTTRDVDPIEETGTTAPDSDDADTGSDGADGDSFCDNVDGGCTCDYLDTPTGVCANSTLDESGECSEPAEYIPQTQSEAPEHCDGLDNDCDGDVDEDCSCTAGDTQSCYTGSEETEGVGTCTSGEQTCTEEDGWGECTGEVLPESDETCGDGLDDDCDGAIDENCPCDYLDKPEGVCADQTSREDGTCPEPEDFEAAETSCDDGIDNDCDGAVDLEDPDCKSDPGELCSSDDECRSTCLLDANGDERCAYRIFATSSTHRGGFGGANRADSICEDRADDAGLTGDWIGLVSTDSVDAKDRITVNGPVANTNDAKIAESEPDLFNGAIDNPVAADESGSSVSTDVWTGTNDSGEESVFGACDNWSTNGASKDGRSGEPNATDGTWLNSNTTNCNQSRRIYCVEQ